MTIRRLGVSQADFRHAFRINQIIAKTGIGVTPVSVSEQNYTYILALNAIIDALGLSDSIVKLGVSEAPYITALTINEVIEAIESVVYGLKFNKSSIYGTLANRVIDVTGDIEIEFYTPDYIGTAGLSQSIVAQCAASTYTAQEFELYFSGGSGNIVVNIGGTITSVLLSGQFTASTQYRIVLSGATSTVYNMAGGVIRTTALSRGAAREPSAAVTIGARFNGSSMIEYFGGVQRNLKINGVLWPMNLRDQLVQPSTPAGNSMTLTGATLSDWVTVS